MVKLCGPLCYPSRPLWLILKKIHHKGHKVLHKGTLSWNIIHRK